MFDVPRSLLQRQEDPLPAQFSSHKMRHLLSFLSYFLLRFPRFEQCPPSTDRRGKEVPTAPSFGSHTLRMWFSRTATALPRLTWPVFCIVRVAEAELHLEGICHQNLRSRSVQFHLDSVCNPTAASWAGQGRLLDSFSEPLSALSWSYLHWFPSASSCRPVVCVLWWARPSCEFP